MAAETPLWDAMLFGIVLHPATPSVLLLPGTAGWSLPWVQLDSPVWRDNLGIVTSEMRALLGIAVVAYRYADYRRDDAARREEGAYVLEAIDQAGLPAGARWVGPAELASLALERPEHRAAIVACLAEATGGAAPARRAPWARPGWFGAAASWLEAELVRRGFALAQPVEQVRNWSLSCVLRATTTAGAAFYLKAAAAMPLFVDEPALLTALAARCPGRVPAPLAVDRERGWMLLADFGAPLGAVPLARREEAIRAFGQLQVEFAGRASELLALGCVDRRLEHLAAQIGPLLKDSDALADLDQGEIRRLHAHSEWLADRCGDLAGYAVPPTLLHGDLDTGNIAHRDGTLLFFDWTDGAVGHPFLDMLIIFGEKDSAARRTLRDAYLDLWTAYESRGRLLEAWRLGEILHALHHAVSYWSLANSVEARCRAEVASGVPLFLRRLLASADRQPEHIDAQ